MSEVTAPEIETVQAPSLEVSQLAAEKRTLLSRLLARMAHEVRNPLSSLDIHVQLLQEDLAQFAPPLREKAAARLEIIRGELHRLDTIVEGFLRLAGPSSLEFRPVEIAAVCERVCRLLRPEAEARQIELATRLEGPLPPLLADADQLTQALLNLVLNALQAVERQGRIELCARGDSGDALALEVRDTGPGVPVGDRAAIFDPFFTTKADGTGLGLWIAQQIVAAHGGEIHVTNTPAGGAVFTIHLPLPRDRTPHG